MSVVTLRLVLECWIFTSLIQWPHNRPWHYHIRVALVSAFSQPRVMVSAFRDRVRVTGGTFYRSTIAVVESPNLTETTVNPEFFNEGQ